MLLNLCTNHNIIYMDKRGINVGVTKDPCYSRGILSVAALVPWLRPAPAIISSIRAPIIKGTIVTSLHFQSFLSSLFKSWYVLLLLLLLLLQFCGARSYA